MNWRRICGWLLTWAWLAAAGPAFAQGGAESAPPLRFSDLGSSCGLNQYMSEAWGVVGVSVVNTEDQPAEVLAAFGFSKDPDLQFARRIWVPAQTLRRTWVPLKLPRVPPSRESVVCYGLLIDDRSGSEVVLRDEHEGVQHSSLLRVNHDRPVTGAFVDQDEEADPNEVDYPYEAVVALRTARGYQRGLALIHDRDLPPLRELFDGLDQMVLWNDRFASEVAILAALRVWLNDGGELWIMLDRVDFAGVERLLGETFTCQLVNRVVLPEAIIQAADEMSSAAAPPPASSQPSPEYSWPLNFVRVIVSGMQVTHTVQGWPAAFWRPVGRGRVVFTTVDAQAWIRRARAQRQRWDPNRMTDYEPTPQLEALSLLRPRPEPLAQPAVFRDYLTERIGYRIASRGPVGVILGLFCAALLVAGASLARLRRPEHLAWIAPCLTLLAAVPLSGLGWRSQRAVPATVGQAQFLEVSEGADHIIGSGLLTFYDPAPAPAAIGARHGGVFAPESVKQAGTTRRMVWTDLDQWHWENIRPTTGLHTASFQWSSDVAERPAVRGTFTATGFVARWTGKVLPLSDTVVFMPAQPCLAVRADGAGLVGRAGDVLAPGRYVAGRWLSDEQRRRQAVIEQMFQRDAEQLPEVFRPRLLGWGDPVDMGFLFPQHQQQVGTALWSLPLEIDRPPAGTRIVIPSPFVRFRAVNLARTENASPLHDYRTGRWLHSQKASETWLRFQVPEAALPLRLERARFTLQITAPSRIVQIVRRVGNRTESLREANNPIGQIELALEGAMLPELDEAGRLLLGIVVSRESNEAGNQRASVWKIDSVQLEVAGTALPGEGK